MNQPRDNRKKRNFKKKIKKEGKISRSKNKNLRLRDLNFLNNQHVQPAGRYSGYY